MAVEKVVIETIVCDKDGKKGKKEDGWKVNVTLQFGDAKWKGDLCPTCHAKVKAFGDDFLKDMAEDVTTSTGDYDVHADPRMQKLTREAREHQYAAKLWAVGPKSTMKANDRPTGVRGPAGPKVLAAYEAYMQAVAAKQPAPA